MGRKNFIDDYVKVNERLLEFREKYPEGFITTFRQQVEGGISFKAVVFRNKEELSLFPGCGIAAASGHSFLRDGENGDKVEEYTETVCIGRALAILGFKADKSIASSEEMERFNSKKEVKTKSKETVKDDSVKEFKQTSRFKTKAAN